MKSTTLLSPKNTVCAITTLLYIQIGIAQSVGIGTDSPNPSARLEVNSTSQGILIPTLTSLQRNAVSNPATGLLVFQTDGTPGFYFFAGVWINLSNGFQPNGQGLAVSPGYGITTTLAGNGRPGPGDGTGIGAFFSDPTGVAVDGSGNVYVADRNNHKIRKIIPLTDGSGMVTTIAGAGVSGFADGSANVVLFNGPTNVAVDAFGNLYVADYGNNKIRKISATGNVTTLAGTGLSGLDDGPGATASFDSPKGVAVDAAGNVYVADQGNHKIRKIVQLSNGTGEVSTLAGNILAGFADGPGTSARFSYPAQVAVDASGNLYVADQLNNRIRKIIASSNGTVMVTTLAGTGASGSADGPGNAATFNEPVNIAVDAFGNIYVAEPNNSKIRKITPVGMVSTLAGTILPGDTDGTGTTASFNNPSGIAVDVFGNVYVADRNNNKVRRVIAK